MHCRRFLPPPLSRRELLVRSACGFGAVALAGLWPTSGGRVGAAPAAGETGAGGAGAGPQAALGRGAALQRLHHRRRATSVIFLYMDGGPSQVDTFDPKPRLDREHGRPIQMKHPPTQFNDVGQVLRSPWRFRPRGQCGTPISDLLPHTAAFADDLAVIRSMVSPFSEHTSANYFLHSGNGQQGRPSMGAWLAYGLGSQCDDLPGFVVLDSGLIPPGGLDCFGAGFLPAEHQGSVFQRGPLPVADLSPAAAHGAAQDERAEGADRAGAAGGGRDRSGDPAARRRDLVRTLDSLSRERLVDRQVEAAVANYELAFRMQAAVPELVDLADETAATLRLYGIDNPASEVYGRQCLIARRLVERGVRFVEVLCPKVDGDRWDQHSNLKQGHENNARATDQPVAGLLGDLKARGLLEETVVVWAGEFGRTPMAQGNDGRDHNPFGFSIWLAGGGIRGGTIYGATDDYGYYAVENKTEIHDLHATLLYLLGVDHTGLTFRFGGRDMRLTDVHGHVIEPIIA